MSREVDLKADRNAVSRVELRALTGPCRGTRVVIHPRKAGAFLANISFLSAAASGQPVRIGVKHAAEVDDEALRVSPDGAGGARQVAGCGAAATRRGS